MSSVGALSGNYATSAVYTGTAASKVDEAMETLTGENAQSQAQSVDSIEISEEGKKQASKTKGLSADQLQAIQEQQTASFKNMLAKMLNSQAGFQNIADGTNLEITKDLFSKLNITPADSAKAAQAISDDGEWGVDAVATRIMDMAVALSGGDTEKLSVLRDAVEKGFAAAEKQWGGELPTISQDTHKEISNRFDYWEKYGTLDGYTMGKADGEDD